MAEGKGQSALEVKEFQPKEKDNSPTRPSNTSGHSLLVAAKKFEDLLNTQRVELLDDLAESHVVLHKDSIFTHKDQSGLQNVKRYLQAFFKKYEYSHRVVCLAADEKQRIAFTFTVDDGVKPKENVFSMLSREDTTPSRCMGIWKYQFDAAGLISDIHFLRQPSRDEIARKFVNPPDYSRFPFDPDRFQRPILNADEKRTEDMLKVAEAIACIWTGRLPPSHASKLLHTEVVEQNLLFGTKRLGKAVWIDTVQYALKDVYISSRHYDVAVTPCGNKAFIHWVLKGKDTTATGSKDKKVELYGMDLLVFGVENKFQVVKEILALRQPLAAERQRLLK